MDGWHERGERPARIACHIPVYRPDGDFRLCLDSIAANGLCPYVIVVDDASPDPVRVDFAALGLEGEILRHETNRGVAAASNTGIRRARELGFSLIARLDADDMVHPQRFERAAAHLAERPEMLAAFSSAHVIDDAGKRIGTWKVPPDGAALKRQMSSNNCLCTSSGLFRDRFFDTYGLYDETLRNTEDYALFLGACLDGRVALIPEPLVDYRVHATSLSFAGYRRQLSARWRVQAKALGRTGMRGAAGLCRTTALLGTSAVMPAGALSRMRSRLGLTQFKR